MFAEHGRSFIVLHSTTSDESASRIAAQLHPGAAVTTFKNRRRLRGHRVRRGRTARLQLSVRRTRKLISIAHPKFRDELAHQAREMRLTMG